MVVEDAGDVEAEDVEAVVVTAAVVEDVTAVVVGDVTAEVVEDVGDAEVAGPTSTARRKYGYGSY
ncbi:MAG: hypothetical protein V1792_14670 [Pseudomonadota bacterium]